MNIYRRIWINHFGPIPKDQFGRSFEIHHIDGNHNNNEISNLMCVSIQEHYNIHYNQKDWGACSKISNRMNLDPSIISELKRNHALERVKNGTNPFLYLGSERIKNGSHNWLTKEHSENTSSRQIRAMKNGTHNFLIELACPHCNKIGQSTVMKRWHFDNCKQSPNYTPKPKRKYKKRSTQTT